MAPVVVACLCICALVCAWQRCVDVAAVAAVGGSLGVAFEYEN